MKTEDLSAAFYAPKIDVRVWSVAGRDLRANMVRVETDFTANKINGKIQEAEQAKVHTMLVIGFRDMEAGAVSVRLHGKGSQGAKPKAEAIAEILAAIRERRP